MGPAGSARGAAARSAKRPTIREATRAEARRRGMDEIEVGTEKTNLAAQRFYRRVGFDEEYVLLGEDFHGK